VKCVISAPLASPSRVAKIMFSNSFPKYSSCLLWARQTNRPAPNTLLKLSLRTVLAPQFYTDFFFLLENFIFINTFSDSIFFFFITKTFCFKSLLFKISVHQRILKKKSFPQKHESTQPVFYINNSKKCFVKDHVVALKTGIIAA